MIRETKKAQISVEFIIIFAVMMAIFLLVFSVVNARNDEFFFSSRSLDAKDVADRVAHAVNQVYLSGPGSNASLSLPDTIIDNLEYNLTAHSQARSIVIEWSGRHYISGIITTLRDSQTVLEPGRLDIRYSEEGIVLEQ